MAGPAVAQGDLAESRPYGRIGIKVNEAAVPVDHGTVSGQDVRPEDAHRDRSPVVVGIRAGNAAQIGHRDRHLAETHFPDPQRHGPTRWWSAGGLRVAMRTLRAGGLAGGVRRKMPGIETGVENGQGANRCRASETPGGRRCKH